MRRYLIPATIVSVLLSAVAIATWSLTGLRQTNAAAPSIRLVGNGSSFEVIGFNRRMLARLAADSSSPGDWPEIFDVYPGDGVPATDSGMPPMLGDYRVDVDGERLIFTPRFPLLPGLSYTARFKPPAGREITATFAIPPIDATPTTRVAAVYPSAEVLPANQLKLYLHFSAPMSVGEAYRHLRLYDAAGREVSKPFLQIDEELWDAERKRFTLLFDPGRVKRGLRSNLEDGSPLVEGSSYRLVIDRAWRDGDGREMVEAFQKRFTVGPADRRAPDPRGWRVTAPKAGATEALRLIFDEPMDRALAERMIAIEDERGEAISGRVEIANEEREWRFLPDRPWRAGSYRLGIDIRFEDRAGNNLRRLFDADLRARQSAQMPEKLSEKMFISFEVIAPTLQP